VVENIFIVNMWLLVRQIQRVWVGFVAVSKGCRKDFGRKTSFLSQLPAEDYRQWKQALDRAVIEKRFAKKWVTCKSWRLFYSDFEMTQEKFHGVSMFVPQNPDGPYSKQYAIYNQDIQQLQWYQAAGWRSEAWRVKREKPWLSTKNKGQGTT